MQSLRTKSTRPFSLKPVAHTAAVVRVAFLLPVELVVVVVAVVVVVVLVDVAGLGAAQSLALSFPK